MKASHLLKHNIDTLLLARHQTRHDLAQWCRRSDAWLSKIMSDSAENQQGRNVPLKYLDRIADFFGIATYQLFQPGISPLTERRSGRDRRTGLDRRVSNREAQLRPKHTPDLETVTPGERTHLMHWRKLSAQDRKQLDAMIAWALRPSPGEPSTETSPAARAPLSPPIEPTRNIPKQRRA
jgi:hypothetical protein